MGQLLSTIRQRYAILETSARKGNASQLEIAHSNPIVTGET